MSAKRLLLVLALIFVPLNAWAAKTTIAVAANFTAAAKDIAKAFEAQTGHKAVLAFGSTGKLFAQIAYGAPFDAFLAADVVRPGKAVQDGFAVQGSQFTYALGKIVLFSADESLVDGNGDVLGKGDLFNKIAIANPKTAPYGAAAVDVLQKLGLYVQARTKLVKGDNIAQTYQFVMTQNAQLGFVAYAQVIFAEGGSTWVVPENLYTPIRQDAVLLDQGKDNPAAKAFLEFLKSDQGRAIIQKYGYGVDE
ncbi:molybdate ABC transporter substrate-binding protein [Magnetovibrio sp. PR-2]|uniref:molybdate ABC transporter substrate-binding protein n=1 Tax=Magnetovibrio sp. PR-2 TaxID=3120356 RepID=UPI002FCE64B4